MKNGNTATQDAEFEGFVLINAELSGGKALIHELAVATEKDASIIAKESADVAGAAVEAAVLEDLNAAALYALAETAAKENWTAIEGIAALFSDAAKNAANKARNLAGKAFELSGAAELVQEIAETVADHTKNDGSSNDSTAHVSAMKSANDIPRFKAE